MERNSFALNVAKVERLPPIGELAPMPTASTIASKMRGNHKIFHYLSNVELKNKAVVILNCHVKVIFNCCIHPQQWPLQFRFRGSELVDKTKTTKFRINIFLKYFVCSQIESYPTNLYKHDRQQQNLSASTEQLKIT